MERIELCEHDQDPLNCDSCHDQYMCQHGCRTDQIECEECADEEELWEEE